MVGSEQQPEKIDKIHYAISTTTGVIPYIIECTSEAFMKPRVIFLDDFLFKNSIYDRNQKIDISTFIAANAEVAIAFRNPTESKKNVRIISSKAGNYKLTSEKYNDVLQLMNGKNCANFETGTLLIGEKEFVEPVSLSEYVKGHDVIFGTQIINKLAHEGMMIYIDGPELKSKRLEDTDHEYEKYMLTINEMNAFTFIAEHNYKTLYEFSEL